MFENILLVIGIGLGVGVLVALVTSLNWVYHDARARGKTASLWFLIAFFTWPFGVFVYRAVRDKPIQL